MVRGFCEERRVKGGEKKQTNLWGAAVVCDSLLEGLALLDLLQEISVHGRLGRVEEFRATETEKKKVCGGGNETRSVTPFEQKRKKKAT